MTLKEFLLRYAEAAERSGGVVEQRGTIRSRELKNKNGFTCCPLEMVAGGALPSAIFMTDILESNTYISVEGSPIPVGVYIQNLIMSAADWTFDNPNDLLGIRARCSFASFLTAVRAWRGVLSKVGA